MLRKIEALRKEPKHVRNRYAFWSAATITLVITLIWTITLPGRFKEVKEAQVPQTHTAESSFKKSFGEMTQDFKDTLAGFRARMEYSQEEVAAEPENSNTLDLQALVASSSQRKLEARNASSSTEIVNATTSSSTARN